MVEIDRERSVLDDSMRNQLLGVVTFPTFGTLLGNLALDTRPATMDQIHKLRGFSLDDGPEYFVTRMAVFEMEFMGILERTEDDKYVISDDAAKHTIDATSEINQRVSEPTPRLR